MQPNQPTSRVAIACGGTGGHLFPGLAVAEQLRQRGCAVTVLISPKEVDQKAIQTATGVDVATLPAVGLTRGSYVAFARGCIQSYRASKRLFRATPPDAVLAMGGFTSAPPVIAGKKMGLPTFLHESNTIPGRANRWLSRVVDCAFVGFAEAAARLGCNMVVTTGTPVRGQFQPGNETKSREALGLDPRLPVLLVTGGSQGASGLNDLVAGALPILASRHLSFQALHLTGPKDVEKMEKIYSECGIRAVVKPFMADMHAALGAATAAVSRAGASSLAELAAMRLPSLLVPFPAATDNHQFYNASAFVKTGAARLMEQKATSHAAMACGIVEMLTDTEGRKVMMGALAGWHFPDAAEKIAEGILSAIEGRRRARGVAPEGPPAGLRHRQSVTT